MMKTPTYCIGLLFFGMLTTGLRAQEYHNPDEVIGNFFTAIENPSDSARRALLSDLFLKDGLMTAVIQGSAQSAQARLGSYEAFLEGTDSFYDEYDAAYDEIERSIDYYVDMAMVHSLVYQTLTEKSVIANAYEEMLWFSFTIVFKNERWYIASAIWVNAFESVPIDEAMLQDTLWHQPNKK